MHCRYFFFISPNWNGSISFFCPLVMASLSSAMNKSFKKQKLFPAFGRYWPEVTHLLCSNFYINEFNLILYSIKAFKIAINIYMCLRVFFVLYTVFFPSKFESSSSIFLTDISIKKAQKSSIDDFSISKAFFSVAP